MKINAKKILGLPVNTKTGVHLGKIYDFEVDIESGMIFKYIVSDSLIAKNILQKELVIDRSQVIMISSKEMIVEDNILREGSGKLVESIN